MNECLPPVPGFEGRWFYGAPTMWDDGSLSVTLYEVPHRRLELRKVPTGQLDEAAARAIHQAENDHGRDFMNLAVALDRISDAVDLLREADSMLRSRPPDDPLEGGPALTHQAMILGGLQQVLEEFANDLAHRYGLEPIAPAEAHQEAGYGA